MNATSKTTIYWDENGQTACSEHAPYRGTDTWRSGRWRKITPAQAAEFEREVGRPPSCETCDAMARRAGGGGS